MPRKTRQRDAIQEVMEHAERPLSAQEIWTRSQDVVPQIGLATIYRYLAELETQEGVTKLDIPNEAPHFELAGRPHHHHFFCRQCRRVYNLPGCVKNIRALVPKSFEVEDHDILIYGKCRDCSLRS